MTEEQVVAKVREIMNEAGADETLLLLSEDTVKLDVYIKSVITDAIHAIQNYAPLRFLNLQHYTDAITDGVIPFPSDCVRIVSIKLSGWKRSVSVVYEESSEEYKIQHNEITTAGVHKPKCVFSNNTIECFPAGDLENFSYIGEQDITSFTGLLAEAICYYCASLVYKIFEMPQQGEAMKAVAAELIPKE